jgi:WD40 repeat protein
VISRIEKTFTFSRKDERLRKTSIAVSILLSLLIAASLMATWIATNKTVEATEKAQIAARATEEANVAEERARRASETAILQEKLARSREYAAQAASEMDKQLDVALSYSLMAFDESPKPSLEARQSLLAGLTFSPHLRSFVTPRNFSGAGDDLAVSADGQLIVSRDYQTNRVQLWQNTSGPVEPRILFERTDTRTDAVTITQDGKAVAAGFDDQTVRFCNTATAGERQKVLSYPKKIGALAFNARGDKLAVGLQDGAVYVWDVGSDSPAGRLLGTHPDKPRRGTYKPVELLAFSPDDKNLASYSAVDSLIIWDLMSQKRETKPATLEFELVRTLCFSPDSRLPAFNSGRSIMLWDRKSRKLATGYGETARSAPFSLSVGEPRRTTDHPEDEVICITFGGKNDELLSVSEWRSLNRWHLTWDYDQRGTSVWVWHKDSSEVLLKGPDDFRNAAFADQGRMIITQSSQGRITTWNVEPQHTLCSILADEGTRDAIFNPVTGSHVSVGDYGMAVWEGSERKDVLTNTPSTAPTTADEASKGWRSLEVSADGKRIIAGSWTDKYSVLDADSYAILYSFNLPRYKEDYWDEKYVSFDADLRLAVAPDTDGAYCIWEIGEQPVQLARIEGRTPFSFGRHVLAGRGPDGDLCLWEIADPKLPRLLDQQPFDWRPSSFAFSGDGKLLATVHEKGVVSLWSVGQKLDRIDLRGNLPAEFVPVPTGSSVAFSPNDQVLAATGHGSKSVSLWDISTRRLIGHIPTGHNSIDRLSFSPDGRKLAGAVFGEILIVDLDPDSWKKKAHALIGSREGVKR